MTIIMRMGTLLRALGLLFAVGFILGLTLKIS